MWWVCDFIANIQPHPSPIFVSLERDRPCPLGHRHVSDDQVATCYVLICP